MGATPDSAVCSFSPADPGAQGSLEEAQLLVSGQPDHSTASQLLAMPQATHHKDKDAELGPV